MNEELWNEANEKLAVAAERGDLEQVKALAHFPVDWQHDNSRGLRRAAREGHQEIVELMLQKGAEAKALDSEALRSAVAGGYEKIAELLLARGANVNALKGAPLIKAVSTRRANMVRMLLAYRACPHFGDNRALRQAALDGSGDIVRALLKAGADPFALHDSAMALANPEKHGVIVDMLAERMFSMREEFRQDFAAAPTPKDFLRARYKTTGESALVRALKLNLLGEALDKMKEAGDTLSHGDLYGLKDRGGRPLGVLAAERGRLKDLFDAALWRGNLDELQKCWEEVPVTAKVNSGLTAEGFQSLIAEHRQLALRNRAPRFRLKPPGM